MQPLELFGALAAMFCFLALAIFVTNKRKPPTAEAGGTHVFFDLETLGLKHDAPILVIAAYVVDSMGVKIQRKQWRISVEDALRYGVKDAATAAWWEQQSEAAKHAAFFEQPRLSLANALDGVSEFLARLDGEVFIWGNAPTFDCAILRHAYEQLGKLVPWEFWQERDCRTVAWVGQWLGFDAKKTTDFKGEPHNALDDARHQSRYTIAILKRIGGKL